MLPIIPFQTVDCLPVNILLQSTSRPIENTLQIQCACSMFPSECGKSQKLTHAPRPTGKCGTTTHLGQFPNALTWYKYIGYLLVSTMNVAQS